MAHELPPVARRFLRSQHDAKAEQVVRRFHRWMEAKHVIPTGLTRSEVESFFGQPFRRAVSYRSSQSYKRALIDYLDWLYEHGQLDFDPKSLGIRNKRALPACAETFLRSLEPTLRPGTRQGYRSSVRRFHNWLADNRLTLRRLKRPHVEQWCLALSDEGLHPSTRCSLLIQIRVYLCWLLEQGELRADAFDLIRSSDLPKLPTYLPRPLSPEQDIELQRRLEASANPLHQGLLLMRLTGLRIGELISLSADCVRVDLHGHRFLKIPLGKLHNERLVPLDSRTLTILERLQHCASSAAEYLVEDLMGRPVSYRDYRVALADASQSIPTKHPITSHRLRHTYATSLLAAGMSLTSVMKLLGHRDFRMTLRYAAITEDTLRKEYLAALPIVQSRYPDLTRVSSKEGTFDPVKSLAEILRWVQHNGVSTAANRSKSRSLIKRLQRIHQDLLVICHIEDEQHT